jgi:hypothetical protein
MGWEEKRLLAYHETFNTSNIYSMQYIVSIGISAAKILLEDVSYEYHSGTNRDIDVVRSRIETYIKSSLRKAFAQVSSNKMTLFAKFFHYLSMGNSKSFFFFSF